MKNHRELDPSRTVDSARAARRWTFVFAALAAAAGLFVYQDPIEGASSLGRILLALFIVLLSLSLVFAHESQR